MRNEQYLWRKRNEQHLQRRRTTSGSGAEEKPVTVGLCQANRKAKPSEEGHTTAPKKGNALHVSGCTNISTESKNLEA
jgi:hypothetical protein